VKQTTVTEIIALIQEAGQERIALPTELTSGGHRLGSIDTSMPVSTVRCDQGQRRSNSVVVTEDGTTAQTVILNDRQIPIGELGFELKALFNHTDERITYLRTAKDVSYGTTIRVMSLIKRAGANEIVFELGCDSADAHR
jgi:biopolymer transport protein ExbD